MSQVNPSWLGSQATSSGLNPNSFGTVTVTGSNTTVTNALANANSIILLTAVSASSGTATPSISSRSAGSFVVLVGGGVAGLGAFNYLILS